MLYIEISMKGVEMYNIASVFAMHNRLFYQVVHSHSKILTYPFPIGNSFASMLS